MIDLLPFCGKDSYGPYIATPFTRHGFTWATNGHIAVRVPLRPDVDERDDAPHIEKVWSDAKSPLKEVIPFKLPERMMADCDICDGRGHMHECPDCSCKCEECHGSGMVEIINSVSVGKVFIQSRYAALMMSLPALRVEMAADKCDRVHFDFEGGCGLVIIFRYSLGIPIVADIFKGLKS